MRMTGTTKTLLLFTGTLLTSSAMAQPRAEACFFWNDFEGEDALAGWDLGPTVERRTPDGQGLGLYVPAWNTGDAGNANSAGYFPVPDSPVGNRFAMANDAAAPCNCNMADVSLATPLIDLSDRVGVALECRAFNESLFGAGPATVQVSTVDGEWTTVYSIPTVLGQWQRVFVDLGEYAGSPNFRLRFNWSDGGTWAGGFAVDDICIRERSSVDLVVSNAQAGASSASVNTLGDQGLYYRQIPLSQVAPVTIAATVKNSGTEPLHDVRISATVDLAGNSHGPFQSEAIDELQPGATQELSISTNWTPAATGHAALTVTGSAAEPDVLPGDETAFGQIRFTGPGWDNGHSVMACDDGIVTGSIGGNGRFLATNRMEIVNPGDHAAGISVVYAQGTEGGALVRAVLMDANYTTLDTSARRTLQQTDIEAIWNGLPLYEAFTNAPALQPGDYHIGIQRLPDNDAPVRVAVGGSATPERSALLEGIGFTVNYVYTTPMVRLHLEEVPVSVPDRSVGTHSLHLFPNPATDMVAMILPAGTMILSWEMIDMSGRMVSSGIETGSSMNDRLALDITHLSPGYYVLVARTTSGTAQGRLVVTR